MAEVRRRSTGHPTDFSIDLEFRGPGYEGEYGFEVAEVRGGGFRVARENCGVWLDTRSQDGKRGADARFRIDKGVLTDRTEPVMPPVSEQRLYLVSAAGLDAFRLVFDGLAGISVFSLNPDVMRQPQTPDAGDFLHRDGANTSSVLHRLESAVKPGSKRISSRSCPGCMRCPARSWAIGRRWSSLRTSPGRRTLAVPGPVGVRRDAACAGGPGRTVRRYGPTLSTVGIEEPESALHPAAAGVLLDALRDAGERRQVIVTSHSPDLLDRHDFELSQLRAVRSIGGETRIGPLDAAGASAMRERLYTPGELLRTDQLLPEAAQ